MSEHPASSRAPTEPAPGAEPEAAERIGPIESFRSYHLLDLLRSLSRHCRRMLECEVARIWLARRGGARLVARDFPDGEAPAVEHRLARGEGLAGWVFTHDRPLR